MDHTTPPIFDPASQARAGYLADLATDAVAASDGLDFWRHTVLRRNEPLMPAGTPSFRARLRRVVLDDVELIEHASDPMTARSMKGRTSFDGGDDIAIEFTREGVRGLIEHNGEHRLAVGEIYIVDYARPLLIKRSVHRAAGLVLSRRRVTEILGEDLSSLAGRRIKGLGLASLLRQQMTSTLDGAPQMTSADRVRAVQATAELGLATLQREFSRQPDAQRFGEGFYVAARKLIERQCVDPDISPDQIAVALGCSRASLYRVFDGHGESVSAAIWQARLEKAMTTLSCAAPDLLVADVARQAGFRDQATFARMFRRRFGLTPRDARRRASIPQAI